MQIDRVLLSLHALVDISVEDIEATDALLERNFSLSSDRSENSLHVYHEGELIHFIELAPVDQ